VPAWYAELVGLLDEAAARWPSTSRLIDDMRHTATQLAAAAPEAEAFVDSGDGLRSPSFEGGGRSIGAHADPTFNVAAANVAAPGRHTPVDLLAEAADHRRQAVRSLRLALCAPGVEPDAVFPERPERAQDGARVRPHMPPMRPQMTTTRECLDGARAHLAEALSLTHRVLPPTTTLRRLKHQGDKGCLAHRRTGRFAPTDKRHRGLCRWCYDYQRAHGTMPTPEVVARHDAGYPIPARPKPKPVRLRPDRTPSRQQRMLTRLEATTERLGHL